ncbi:MAG: DUF2141 domain-containing protein [Tepidisphaerales bacterium]
MRKAARLVGGLAGVVLSLGLAGAGEGMQHSATAPAAMLRVTVVNVRTQEGKLRLSVYDSPEGFPRDEQKAVARVVLKASEADAPVEFSLPPGRYAVAVLHDENDNGRMDTNFWGVPSEGYGVSNNVRPRFRAPRFHEAAFDLPANGLQATVSMHYPG